MGIIQRIRRVIHKRRLHYSRHPIDRQLGIRTSHHISRREMATGDRNLDDNNVGYGNSQPSVIRAAISRVPALDTRDFIDLGCARGRVLAVASEFPFAHIYGIDIVAALADSARDNAERIAARHPERTSIIIKQGDATDVSAFAGRPLLLFLYNSFRAPLVENLIGSIEQLAQASSASIYLVYYNPVHFHLFDQNDLFERFAVEQIPFEAEEMKYRWGTNRDDLFAIYRVKRAGEPPVLETHGRAMRVDVPDLGARLVE